MPLKDRIVDAIVTDPPYGLSFMGKEWDHGVPGVEFWREAWRVLKPGAYLLAFGGTRTFHRLTCAIEDAGFEIRDCINWLYGSGFPKSLDVSKAIDKAAGAEREIVGVKIRTPVSKAMTNNLYAQDPANRNNEAIFGYGVEKLTKPMTNAAREWQGWGTALKPAWEPIIVARKPIEGTVAENVQKYGTGAMNIDACRITVDKDEPNRRGATGENGGAKSVFGVGNLRRPATLMEGRWPANVILDEEAAAMLDEQSGETVSPSSYRRKSNSENVHAYSAGIGEKDGTLSLNYGDSGGASRFFYTAKADRKDRGEGNDHPTVKPQAIVEYLLKLISRPGALILDPFCGSGTTVLVADKMGRNAVGLDNDAQSPIKAKRRVFNDAPLLAL